MTISEIQALCIEGSITYYKYLEKEKKGRSEIRVYSIEIIDKQACILKLKISGKIFEIDSIYFYLVRANEEYDSKSVRIVEYDYETNTLLIQPTEKYQALFLSIVKDDLKIISDLKFLVKRVGVWYRLNGDKIQIPVRHSSEKENLKDIQYFPDKLPTEQQKNAIQNIFSNPFSYVWGAPGTGKTQFVLAYSIIHYIRANKKVAIYASTNTAIEQVLHGVLAMTQQAGIDNKQILRLGTPTKKFAEKYPDVCEIAGIAKKILEVNNQILIINKILEKESIKKALGIVETSLSYFDDLIKLDEEKSILISNIKNQERELKSLENSFDLNQSRINFLNTEISKIEKSIKSFFHSTKKIFLKSNSSQENQLFEKQNENKIKTKENQSLIVKIKDFQNRISSSKSVYFDNTRSVEIIKQIQSDLSFNPKIQEIVVSLNLDNFQQIFNNLEIYVKETKEEINVKDALAKEYLKYSHDELVSKLQRFEIERENLILKSTEERLKSVNVIAATLDCYIGRFVESELNVEHIFLDEASYANSIKALTLLKGNIPVTFLGDHMQLPPVCELNDSKLMDKENQEVFVWSQSAIYIEDLFLKTKMESLENYLRNENYNSQLLIKSDLKETHRFGANLAKVLNHFVYRNGFVSYQKKGETQIYYINVPFFYPQPKDPKTGKGLRLNNGEVEEIKKFIKANKLVDFAILTPYKRQVEALEDMLPEERNEHKIMSVHRSQGKEWDDVLLSVVDTSDKWFTNTLNKQSRGLQLINTAVSRAKKRLFVFCNKDYWIKQDGQLIRGLIEVGNKY